MKFSGGGNVRFDRRGRARAGTDAANPQPDRIDVDRPQCVNDRASLRAVAQDTVGQDQWINDRDRSTRFPVQVRLQLPHRLRIDIEPTVVDRLNEVCWRRTWVNPPSTAKSQRADQAFAGLPAKIVCSVLLTRTQRQLVLRLRKASRRRHLHGLRIEDHVDNHYFRIFAQPCCCRSYRPVSRLRPTTIRSTRINRPHARLSRQMSQVAGRVLEKNLNIQPTITIRNGQIGSVMVNKDLYFASMAPQLASWASM